MSDTDRVREAYDALPWPAPGAVHAPPLPDHWIEMASDEPVLRPDSRILVAGCGTGGEVAAFASRLPQGRVVGVDISPVCIEHARAAWPQCTFAVGDLAADDLLEAHGSFDFVCCHAVADYVPDAPALLRNLARVLEPGGALYLGTNTAAHPGRRIAAALQRMGLEGWSEGAAERRGLRIVQAILGDRAPVAELARQPAGLLAADVFPAFSHSVEPRQWIAWAEQAGLALAGSLSAQWVVPSLGDRDLAGLYGLDRAAFSVLVEELQANPVAQLLFGSRVPATPPWTDLEALWTWRPLLDPRLGREHFPPLDGDWMVQRFVALGTHGLPELRLDLSAWMLEFYRRADGAQTVAELRAAMPVGVHDEHLRASLWKFWQVGLLGLAS